MTDLVIQLLILAILPVANFFVIRHTKNWLNPLTIISVTFFLPLVFALSRLSGLQANSWDYETYAVILLSILFWALFPTIYLLLQKKQSVNEVIYAADCPYLKSKAFVIVARSFALVVGSFYLLANIIQTHSLLPFLNPELAYLVHADFPPFIRLIARANPAAVALLFVSFFYNRRKVDLFLLLGVFLLPITRLSRIDPFMSGVVLLVLNGYFPLIKFKVKSTIVMVCVATVIGLVGVELGNQRTNRFGTYHIKFEDAVRWKPPIVGPFSVLPVLYGYFPLSFENFDIFVRMNKNRRTYGFQSFDWLFTGVLKVNILDGFDDLKEGTLRYKPVSSAATVPTALYPFYADFGAAGSALPLCFYILIWLELFRRAYRSALSAVLFALYSGGFALSTFQALIVGPLLVQQLFEVAMVFVIVRHIAVRTMNTNGLYGLRT